MLVFRSQSHFCLFCLVFQCARACLYTSEIIPFPCRSCFFGFKVSLKYTHRVVETSDFSPIPLPTHSYGMAPKFKKGDRDRVRVLAIKLDNEERDASGMNFSERWVADGNGTWCCAAISRVYVRKGRQAQKYSIKYDEGSTMMACEEELIEAQATRTVTHTILRMRETQWRETRTI
jgi:hypothetical protein